MIQGLYETHLFVKDLQRSIDFYSKVLGLQQCYYEEGRRASFFWIGETKSSMLGLWEKPENEIDERHFAFRCDKDFILNESVQFLQDRNLKPYNFLRDGITRPMVFTWMPAVSIYFRDPDGHELEFISILEGEGIADGGVVTYEEWMKMQSKK